MRVQTWEEYEQEQREWVAWMAEKAASVGADPEEIASLSRFLPYPDQLELEAAIEARERGVARDVADMTAEEVDDELASYGVRVGRYRTDAETNGDVPAPPNRRGGGGVSITTELVPTLGHVFLAGHRQLRTLVDACVNWRNHV